MKFSLDLAKVDSFLRVQNLNKKPISNIRVFFFKLDLIISQFSFWGFRSACDNFVATIDFHFRGYDMCDNR